MIVTHVADVASTRRETFDILGVQVDSISLGTAIRRIEHWIEENMRTHIVTFTNVHAVMESRHDPEFRDILNGADMVCPDGMPLVWVDRMRGGSTEHVCGPDLMLAFLEETNSRGFRHYFYGGSPEVVKKLAANLSERFAGICVAGLYSPPYRELTRDEDEHIIKMINKANPDVVWVGLGCPKQERWLQAHRGRLQAPVVLGVGQAFDLYAGTLRASPRWMRDNGLEWAFRFCREPKRLWRRYLLSNPAFLLALARDTMRSH